MNKHDTIGIDLVAMCVNDIIVQGAEPLFFLDYLATGALAPEKAADIVKGISEGCQLAGCALIGGETAELPGFYAEGEYDLAGFTVGVVDRNNIIDGSSIQVGEVLIGIGSNGLHSNGYSLARKIVKERIDGGFDCLFPELGYSLGEVMLRPTRIYVKTILNLLRDFQIQGMARTFNYVIGMVLVVPKTEADDIMMRLQGLNEEAWVIGEVTASDEDKPDLKLV